MKRGYNFENNEKYINFVMCYVILFSLLTLICVRCQYLKYNENVCKNIETCDDIICEKITNCSEGSIKPNPASCNCCHMCLKTEYTLTKCRKIEKRRKELLDSSDDYINDLWIPQCDENGDFKLTQKKRQKSICLDKEGNKLFGQERVEFSQNMTCRCSGHFNKLKNEQKEAFMIKPTEHCTSTGDFQKIQCINNLCYCADSETGDVNSRLVLMDHINMLPCYDVKDRVTSYLTTCEKELVRSRELHYQFHLKGINVVGLERIECDPDGTFSPLQCDTSRCSCTNRDGIQIRSYYTDEQKRREEMLCNCARNNEDVLDPGLKCNSSGNYNFTQCFRDDQCFCVDTDGDVISKQTNSTVTDTYFCFDLLVRLNNLENPIMTTFAPTMEFKTTEHIYDNFTSPNSTVDEYGYYN